MRALLRRSAGFAQSELTCGPVSLDTRTSRVSVSGNPIKLTSHEYRLLAYLMHHTGRWCRAPNWWNIFTIRISTATSIPSKCSSAGCARSWTPA